MEHHAPHPNAAFEGFYSKFDLDSGAHIALIICQVRNGRVRPNMVSFTYVPPDDGAIFQHEVWADTIDMPMNADGRGFRLSVPGMGYVNFKADSSVQYRIANDRFSLEVAAKPGVPWSKRANTPESWLVWLPLPLHWHVQSLAAPCEYTATIRNTGHAPPLTISGTASVHTEKNWARSFPTAHMWIQARDGDRGICCAGGKILGLEAFLFGYRSKTVNVDFRPPVALRFLGWSPTMSYTVDWDTRTFELHIQSWRQKVVMRAVAPHGTFFQLSAPFPEGHRENNLAESFRARVHVQIFESPWFGPWKLLHEDVFDRASLEFGGGYYPPAGSNQRSH